MEVYIRGDKKNLKRFKDSWEYSYEDLLNHLCIDFASKEQIEEAFDNASNTYIDDNKNLRYDGICASYINDAGWYREHCLTADAYYVITGDYNGSTLCDDGVIVKNPIIIKEFNSIEDAIEFAKSIEED